MFPAALHLQACGFLEKLGGNQYRLVSELRPHRKHRVGYAAQGQDSSFPREVQRGLVAAAEAAETELLVVDNRYDPKVALRNAEHLIREQVELVSRVPDRRSRRGVHRGEVHGRPHPDDRDRHPHPGATYFGANNYEAGLMGGRHLGRWARRHWEGEVDEVLLVGLTRAGPTPQTRLRGMLTGIKEVLRLPTTGP